MNGTVARMTFEAGTVTPSTTYSRRPCGGAGMVTTGNAPCGRRLITLTEGGRYEAEVGRGEVDSRRISVVVAAGLGASDGLGDGPRAGSGFPTKRRATRRTKKQDHHLPLEY